MLSFIHTTAFGRIIVVAQGTHRRVRDVSRRQKGSELHHQCEFLHNHDTFESVHNYTFESVNNGDHDSVATIFVGLSCELGGFFNYIILRRTIFLLPGV